MASCIKWTAKVVPLYIILDLALACFMFKLDSIDYVFYLRSR